MKWWLSTLLILFIIGAFSSFVEHQELTAVSGLAKDVSTTIGSISFDVNTGEVKAPISTQYRQEAANQMQKDGDHFFGTLSFILGAVAIITLILLFKKW